MSLADQIHQRVLHVPGVATVYAADPAWLTAIKSLGGLLGTGEAAGLAYVVCSESEQEGRPVLTIRLRIGTDGTLPAPETARRVAVEIRAELALRRPEAEVRVVVEIAAIGVLGDSLNCGAETPQAPVVSSTSPVRGSVGR